MLALDVDRTLLTDDYRLLPEVQKAVLAARAHGVTVALVTARGPAALRAVLGELGEVDAVVAFGGALVLPSLTAPAIASDRLLDVPIDLKDALRVVRTARRLGLSLACHMYDRVYVDAIDEHLDREFVHTGQRYETADLAAIDERPYKFLAISAHERLDLLHALRGELGASLSCAFSHANYLEIGASGVTKGAGLRALASALGVDRKAITAIGDSENDLAMFAEAGLPIAMGNASMQVKAAARWITEANGDAGVARAIERCMREVWLSDA